MALEQQDELTLIQRARTGSLDDFNTLVLRYQDRIYTAAYRLLGEPAAAADAAQEAFIRAYRRIDSFNGDNFAGWLGRIVTNICYDELRRGKRRPATSLEELPGADYDDGPALPDEGETPEEAAQRAELNRAIQDCIGALQANQRTVLVMSDVQGMSYQEIADAAGINSGTVKSRLSRARLAMRDCLQAFRELLPAEYRLFNE